MNFFKKCVGWLTSFSAVRTGFAVFLCLMAIGFIGVIAVGLFKFLF